MGPTDVVLVTSDRGVVLSVSPAAARVLGHDGAELVGRELTDWLQPADARRFARTHASCAADGGVRTCTVVLDGEDGGQTWDLTVHPRSLDSGTEHVVLVHDAGRDQRLVSEAALLRRVTELANAGSDAEGTTARAVADIRATMGWHAGRALRLDGEVIVPVGEWNLAPTLQEQADPLSRLPAGLWAGVIGLAATEGRLVTDVDVEDDLYVARAKELGMAGVVALPVVDDGRVDTVLEFLSLTPVRLDDDQRRLLTDVGGQLGALVGRRTVLEELERHRDELARSNAELERFAYVASHDLQEPLRKIIGFAELLAQHRPPQDEDETAFLGYITDGAYRMQQLIKDLLAYSRAGRRELGDDSIDVDGQLQVVLSDLGVAIEETGASVEIRGPIPRVRGDSGQIRAMLQNLIENALKYRSDAPPAITIDAVDHDRHVELVVSDNGIGIAAEHRDNVFEVFRRLHAVHEYSGTGLGLALVERIVTRHGGRVWIETGPDGSGSAFHVTLPTDQEHA